MITGVRRQESEWPPVVYNDGYDSLRLEPDDGGAVESEYCAEGDSLREHDAGATGVEERRGGTGTSSRARTSGDGGARGAAVYGGRSGAGGAGGGIAGDTVECAA